MCVCTYARMYVCMRACARARVLSLPSHHTVILRQAKPIRYHICLPTQLLAISELLASFPATANIEFTHLLRCD